MYEIEHVVAGPSKKYLHQMEKRCKIVTIPFYAFALVGRKVAAAITASTKRFV